jgi:hypothetical protein
MKQILSILTLTTILLTGCATKKISTIEGYDYDELKNQTNYFVLPLGSVSIPGKWEKRNYQSVSRQQFFINEDSIKIAIAFNRFDDYEFNTDGSKKGFEFVRAFYEWDSKFFADTYGLERRILENDSINKYILYQIYGTAKGTKFDTYFLIGNKEGNVNNLSITSTNKWTEKEKVDFLKKLYLKE